MRTIRRAFLLTAIAGSIHSPLLFSAKHLFTNRFLRSEVMRSIRYIDKIAYICVKNIENDLENNWNLIGCRFLPGCCLLQVFERRVLSVREELELPPRQGQNGINVGKLMTATHMHFLAAVQQLVVQLVAAQGRLADGGGSWRRSVTVLPPRPVRLPPFPPPPSRSALLDCRCGPQEKPS